jgi:tetratricopeptide (TPR) repeat protein
MSGTHRIGAVGLLISCLLGADEPKSPAPSKTVEASPTARTPQADTREPYDPELATQNVAFWESRVKRDPDGFLELRELASAYLARLRETGDVADAVKAEKAARRSLKVMKQRNANAWIRLGRSLLAQHRFPEALAAAKTAVALDPAANRLIADVQIELGDYDAAEKALSTEQASTDDLNYLALRARLEDLNGRRDSALRRWREACAILDRRPDMPAETAAWTYTMLGHGLIDAGKLEEGEISCRKALALFPRDYRALTGLAEAAAWREDWSAAADWAGKAVAICPQNPEALRILGEAKVKQGKTKEGEEMYQRLESLCRSFPRIYDRHWIMFCADENRDLDQALSMARSDLELRKDVFAYDTLAWVHFKKGRIREAEAAIGLALARGTDSALLYYHAGMIAQAAGAPDRARSLLSHARELNPYLKMGASTDGS